MNVLSGPLRERKGRMGASQALTEQSLRAYERRLERDLVLIEFGQDCNICMQILTCAKTRRIDRKMWACLPPELWERIFAADTDAAALCFELNSSLKRTAQAFLLSQNILPTKLRRLFDETCSTKQTVRSYVASDFAKELLLASGAVYSKVKHAPDDQVRRLVWELFEENGGLPGLQGRIARERQKASYMQKCQGTSPADAKRKLR